LIACDSVDTSLRIDPRDRATVVARSGYVGTGKAAGCRLLPFLPAIIASVRTSIRATSHNPAKRFTTRLHPALGRCGQQPDAMVIQTLSAKLGIATGHNLAEQCRLLLPRGLCFLLWE